ncbi:unnamed protein product [Arabidopsis thaliana]|uniref:Pyruvate kinase n=1 Tax=Arabidopsis thaliana TaxID=3702 RepID=A0A7G2ESS3_ARATH|nr:unnamed protein product [Arabidopsis thaliana]
MEMLLGGQATNGALRSKTKIVCTLGPASRSVEMIEKLLKAGMNVARFNFSHGSHSYHQETLDNLRTAMDNTGILCAVMLDTKGPVIRTGFLKEGKPIQLKQGQEITISIDYKIQGDSNTISMSYKKLAEDLKPGDVILCSDGTISLNVLSCDKYLGLVRCRCENSALLGERKNVNLPGIVVDLPTLTEKDKEDIMQWGVPNKIDIIALSFVRKGSDLIQVRKLLGEHSKSIMLMSKVENQEGVMNFDKILENSDAFMVARGDLGMEIPIEKMFLAQKTMINKAKCSWETSDCVMLSGETAAGAHPETAVLTMSRICKEAEDFIDYDILHKKTLGMVSLPLSPIESLAASAVSTARSVFASAIVVLTRGGYTAELVAKYRPSVPILSVIMPEIAECSDSVAHVARRGLIYRGIIPVVGCSARDSTEEMIRLAIGFAKTKGICKTGDSIVALHKIDGSSIIKIVSVE